MALDIGSEPFAQSQDASRLTIDELIRIGIHGKSNAVARYDAILWKVRSGFVLVIYGAITAVSTLSGGSEPVDYGWVIPILIGGFALAGFTVDHAFARSKFRVIASRNELVERSCDRARGASTAAFDGEFDRLVTLLEMAGEREDPQTSSTVRRYLRSRESVVVYLSLYVAPVLLACFVVGFTDL